MMGPDIVRAGDARRAFTRGVRLGAAGRPFAPMPGLLAADGPAGAPQQEASAFLVP